MKLLLYCTKAKPMLRKLDKYFLGKHTDNYYWKKGQTVPYNVNGKIVAECDFEVEEIEKGYGTHHTSFDEEGYFDDFYDYMTKTIDEDILLKRSCLNVVELETYNPNYAIHIKNLHIFDKPINLDFYSSNFDYFKKVEKAPQNMMKVWEDQESPRVLISIRPEWLCKILNMEKTIEVRKKVLKEMLE